MKMTDTDTPTEVVTATDIHSDAWLNAFLGTLDEIATKAMHDVGFTDLWYAHPGSALVRADRWHAGIWTGPQQDLICVKKCETNEEAEEWLSPGAAGPLAAIKAATALLEEKKAKQ